VSRASVRHAGPARRQAGLSLLWVLPVLLVAALAGGLITAWVLSRVDLRLLLSHQPLSVIIPQDLTGKARVSGRLDLRLTETIRTQVPVNQRVEIPLKDELKIIANFDGEIPLRMQVRLKDQIPLRQVIDLDTTIEAYLPELGATLKIPLRGKAAIDTVVPVDLVIPVDQRIRLQFSSPVTARIDQRLNVPLVTVIDAEVPIDADFAVPVLNDLEARVRMPTTPSRAVIVEGALTLPLRTLQLGFEEPAP
jgi:hypothetical protein